MTVGMFLGGFGKNPHIPIFGSKPAFYMEYLNSLFIKRATIFEMKKRKNIFIDLVIYSNKYQYGKNKNTNNKKEIILTRD